MLLLDNGAMIDVPGHENETALHDAVNNGRVDCVKLLVSRGASLTLRSVVDCLYRVSTDPGNTGNLLKFNWSSWETFMTRRHNFLHQVGPVWAPGL